MGKSLRNKSLAVAVSLALASSGALLVADTAHADPHARQAASAAVSEVHIITFAEAGLLHYAGDVAGYQGTAPRALGQRKFDANSPAARNYGDYLAAQRDAHVASIEGTIGRPLAVTHSYAVTQNGVAARLNAAEAAAIAQLPGVQEVRPAGVEHLDTYRGPTFIGADTIWSGDNTPDGVGTLGEGITVAVLDGGTNSDHPSFANDASCGFSEGTPKLIAVDCSTSAGGLCTGPNPEANPTFGHGVHTSSTVAGNTIDNTASPAPLLPDARTMSGVAPCAAIRHYKVCQTNSCGGADIVAAIENAITDGVDVLNFSISGGTSPWTDNDRRFLDAVAADVLVAASAGNNSQADPTVIGRVNHRGPWVMTVAASTQDEIIGPSLSVTGPGTPPTELEAISLTPGSTTITGNWPDLNGYPLLTYPSNIEGCTDSGGIPASYFNGTVAIIRRGTCTFTEKITNAFNAGASMVVIANNQAGTISMDTTGAPNIPAFSIGEQAIGDSLIAFVNANPGTPDPDVVFMDGFDGPIAPPTDGAVGDFDKAMPSATQGDVLADFSYRGPTPAPLADLTKPDITGPGVDIYAALDDASGNYGFMSGTSMSSPHLAGAAALIRSVRPDWTVSEVKSALMSTATRAAGTQENGTTPWNIDDVGSGRADLTKAALAGLTLDETFANYLAANPSGGSVDVKDLNIPALRNLNCTPNCSWTRTFKNQLDVQGTWEIDAETGGAFAVSASPSSFTLAPGATQSVTFTATPNGSLTSITFGYVTLTENAGQAPEQHLSAAIRGEGSIATCEPAQLLLDTSFEASGSGSGPWTSTSTNFGSGWCTEGTCGNGGGTAGAHSGSVWAWFGGAGTIAETTTASQAVVIPAGSERHLNYWLWIGSVGGVGAQMAINVDGSPVDTIAEPAVAETGYAQRTVDLSAFADGASHTIEFRYSTPAGANSNYSLDDVTLECEPPAHQPPAPAGSSLARIRN